MNASLPEALCYRWLFTDLLKYCLGEISLHQLFLVVTLEVE